MVRQLLLDLEDVERIVSKIREKCGEHSYTIVWREGVLYMRVSVRFVYCCDAKAIG